ncbi:MAG TPA: aldehyde dehydrogenase family protein [Ilumatobacteraceae bacterium]|nr:aldehyde dehydrogenase family protein [Ilumatobacteraceae bacterium]
MDIVTTPIAEIADRVAAARSRFDAGTTRPLAWRTATLRALRALVAEREEALLDALAADFAKPRAEAWLTEIGFVLSDIDHTVAHLPLWTKPERVSTPVAFKPGRSTIVREPVGVACVIAPWNYPVQLLLLPIVAAIAAGNAVVAKPSELAPHTAMALGDLITALDDPAVAVVQGGVAETTELLDQRFDHILYTGNSRVARIVMRAAAEHLTPVTLELGGKSPAIVSRHADVEVAAKRIAWGKFVNAGQTCIAPDYVLVERVVHDELVERIGDGITAFYGTDPEGSADYARIVNEPHFHRLEKLLDSGRVAVGGQVDTDTRYIAPTVLTGVTHDDPVMGEEIFGPILPVLAVDSLDEAVAAVNAGAARGDKPLALYTFSERDEENDDVVERTTSGGVCVNGTLMHVSNPALPFGGVGESGMGAYHGRFGFETFSHRRAVHTRSTKLDPPLMYPPYTARKFGLLRRGMTMPDPRDVVAGLRGKARGALTRRRSD